MKAKNAKPIARYALLHFAGFMLLLPLFQWAMAADMVLIHNVAIAALYATIVAVIAAVFAAHKRDNAVAIDIPADQLQPGLDWKQPARLKQFLQQHPAFAKAAFTEKEGAMEVRIPKAWGLRHLLLHIQWREQGLQLSWQAPDTPWMTDDYEARLGMLNARELLLKTPQEA